VEENKYKSKIERLTKRLYSRDGIRHPSPSELHKKEYDIPTSWKNEEEDPETFSASNDSMKKSQKKHSILNKLLIASFVFFLGAVGFAYFSLQNESNYVSSNNIEVTVSGPLSIGAGEVLSLELNILNRNSIRLETADLIVEYPEGTRHSENVNQELKRDRESLETIGSGETKQVVIESILFGEEGDEKTIRFSIEYRVPGSNAIFSTERTYDIQINSSPVLLSVETPREVNSGQEIDIQFEVMSNSVSTVEDVLVVVTYPFGFTPTQLSPTASFEERIWRLGDLDPGDRRVVNIRGAMEGQQDEERIFRFDVGVEHENDEKEIGIAFLSHQETITVRRPFIALDLALDGEKTEEHETASGSLVRGDISWQNNTPSKIVDAVIEVSFQGDILDKSSVQGQSGFYRSSDNTLLWESRTFAPLQVVESGGRGEVRFSFAPLGLSSVAGKFKNADILMTLTMRGRRLDAEDGESPVISKISKVVHVTTNVSMSARALHFSGPFINNGPVPPKVDHETTYTIIWSLSNSLNDLSNVSVKAVLPTYVRWMGVVSPSGENVSYNSVGGEITWKVGDISGGTGYTSPVREMAFQIALTPSLSQIGQSPVIIEPLTVTGFDNFTRADVSYRGSSLTTNLSTDPQFNQGDGKVTP